MLWEIYPCCGISTAKASIYVIYPDLFQPTDRDYILAATRPNILINRFFERFKHFQISQRSIQRIYLLIDAYDHFANELLAFRYEEFKDHVRRNGFVRKFYESIKTATAEGIVDRLFVTGVAPLSLDSLTSGFNIGTKEFGRFG